MRRRLVMAVGGILAVAAVGTAQTMMQPAQVQPVSQYRSPFMVGSQPAPMATPMATPMANAATVQPMQYIPVQPIQTYSAPAQHTVNASPVAAAPMPEMQSAPITPMNTGVGAPAIQYLAMPQNNGTLMVAQPVPSRPATPPAPATLPAPGAPGQVPAAAAQAAPLASNNASNACAPTQNWNGCTNNNCCQPCCNPCGPDGRMWFFADYLYWWTQGADTPALVTGSPLGTPRNQAGVLGAPGTYVRYGNENLGDDGRSGFRIGFGGWLDNCRTCGLEAGYFLLNNSFNDDLIAGGIIARPFNNANTGQPDAQLIFYPGVTDGFMQISNESRFTGFDVNFRKNWCCDCCSRTDLIVGFRYLNLEDELYIREALIVTSTDPNDPPAGTQIVLHDEFETRNEFYGPQFGVAGEMRRGAGFISYRALMAIGTTHKDVTIDGYTLITPPGGTPQYYHGGVLASSTNMGSYSRNDFAVVPELNLNVGYQVTDHVRLHVGYTFLYWSNVTRPGDIIDTTVNPSQFPPGTLQGPARPAFTWGDSDFWAHGLNFGGEIRY